MVFIFVYTFGEIVYIISCTLQLILYPDYYNDILTNQNFEKMKKLTQNINQFNTSL